MRKHIFSLMTDNYRSWLQTLCLTINHSFQTTASFVQHIKTKPKKTHHDSVDIRNP